MLRVTDPKKSLEFYCDVMGMTLFNRFDFKEMEFSLYFLGYADNITSEPPTDKAELIEWTFSQPGLLELTHNWGTESDSQFQGYHSGNEDPRGYGHIGVNVPDVYAACERFDSLGIEYVKKPDDGSMKGIAFIKDPDGYWIEIVSASKIKDLLINYQAS